MKKNQKLALAKNNPAFTLGEVLITVIVLGIIAAVTIPSLIEFEYQTNNRTKIKKALSDYEKIVSSLKVTEGLETVEGTDLKSLNGWTSNDTNCSNGKSLFKIKNDLGNCKFTTNDGLFWDISTFSKPVISLSEKDTCRTSTKVNVSKDDDCYNKTFYFTTAQNSGPGSAFVVNDANSDAKYALIYAKIIEETAADKCIAEGVINCDIDGTIYRKYSMTATDVTLSKGCYNSETGESTSSCTSSTDNGSIYLSDPVSSSVYTKDFDPKDCTGSTYEYCLDRGDYYNAAKKYCESKGGRLPTTAEIVATGKAYSGNGVMTADEWSSNGYYSRNVAYDVFTWQKYQGNSVICAYE